jgi:hypothetical protein
MKTPIQIVSLFFVVVVWSAYPQETLSPLAADSETSLTVRGLPVVTNLPPGQTPTPVVQALPVAVTRAKAEVEVLSRAAAATNALSQSAQLPSEMRIKLMPGRARADYGLLNVSFPADVGGEDPVTVYTADGRTLAFRPMFLALRDTVSGESRLLGQVTNRIGLVVSTNWVVYTNVFSGIRGDLRYRYSGGPGSANSLEQDVLLHESPATPAEFAPENVRLEVWTEWFDSEPSGKETHDLDLRANADEGMPGPAIVSDDYISLGSARIGAGHAFSSQDEADKIPVAKLWARVEQRDWLIETVDFLALKPKLDALPVRQAALPQRGSGHSGAESLIRSLQRPASDLKEDRSMWLVSTDPSPRDTVVLDFVIVSSVPLPAGAISWWPGGGNALDALPNGNDGYWVGTATHAAAKVGQGFSFDGVDDGVGVEPTESLGFAAEQNITMEAWIKAFTNSTDYDVMSIIGKRTPYGLGFELYLVQGKLGFQIGTASYGPVNFEVPGDLRDGVFHHVAVTVDRGATNGGKLYVDGVPATFNPTVTPGDLSNYEPVRIGVHPDDALNCFFKGIIDEPAIYERALSQSEIERIYNAGVAGKYNPNCVTAPTNIVAWWPGDGNGYDLARTNSTTLNGATYAAAVVSSGFSFDGTNDGVTVVHDSIFNIGASDNLTIEAWVHPLPNTNDYNIMTLVSKRTTSGLGGAVGYELFLENGVPGFQIANSSGFANFIGGPDLRNGYRHLAVTLDRGATNGFKIYVDGTAVQTFNPMVLSGSLSNSAPVRIGVHPQSGFDGYFKGIIDEVTIYRRALTSTEIAGLYAAGGAGKCKVDSDGDGLSDLQEIAFGTNPNVADSDGDGLTDGDEVFVYRTNPNVRDTDGDGLIDQAFDLFITSPKASVQIP